MKIVVVASYGAERRVYIPDETFVLGGRGRIPGSLTIEVPVAYDRVTFSGATLQPYCQRIDHPTQPYYVIPPSLWRPTVLDDFLAAEIYPTRLSYSESVSKQFPPSAIRKFVQRRREWFEESLTAAGLLRPPTAANLQAAHERLDRLLVVLDLLQGARYRELEEAHFAEERSRVRKARSIPDDEIERTILGLRSLRARVIVATELVRRAVNLDDPGARFPLLAKAAATPYGGSLGVLHTAVERALRGKDVDERIRKKATLPQNLRGATLDLTNASVQSYVSSLEVLMGVRATRVPMTPGYSRRSPKLLTVKHEGRTVFLRADRSLIRRVVRAGGTLAFHGNTLVVRTDEVGGAIQEMELVQTLAYVRPDDIAGRILSAEPHLEEARALAEQARTDPQAARRLADLAMETVFGIDPEVAAALLRARQRYEPT